jgi:hypothetical protein
MQEEIRRTDSAINRGLEVSKDSYWMKYDRAVPVKMLGRFYI